MAQCRLTCHEFIQSAFAPMVAIVASEDADNICLKNNLRFVDMIQPFATMDGDAQIRDPNGGVRVLKDFKVIYENMTQLPPQTLLGKKILAEAVTNAGWDKFVPRKLKTARGDLTLNIEIPSTTSWFEIWREVFLQIQHPMDHEFLRHYVACIIVISSGSENPIDQLQKLSQYQHQQQHQNPNHLPKWFSPNILKCYLVLHDLQQTELSRAEAVFEQMKNVYGGSNCYFLPINSCPLDKPRTNTSDPWNHAMKHRNLVNGPLLPGSAGGSGTGTPKEDLSAFPCRVSEGDSSETDSSISHPLSAPVVVQNDVFEEPSHMPLLLNRDSVSDQLTQYHGSYLSDKDVICIKQFHLEFCVQALIPHAERQIKYLTDVVASRPRSKSLLSATRRWLGSNKPTSTNANSVIYSQEAAELQTRRLGDLCFLFRLYEMASTAYVTAKNDFKSDQAWLYFAGAQEMAGLSAFMHVGVDYPRRYLEGSLQTYLNVCKAPNFAIRLTLLTTEILKFYSDYTEAAMMFIKMTSEESDLLSALMLEQAAHCFINAQRPLPRKYAFHMTLSGHRFSKAGQKAHSLRAYKQALQVYFERNWILVEDHIFYSIGKQAIGLSRWAECLQANMYLIKQVFKTVSSYQSPTQQLDYVKEFLDIFHTYASSKTSDIAPLLDGRELLTLVSKSPVLPLTGTEMFPLPIPAFHPNSTKVLLGDVSSPEVLPEGWVSASGVSFSDEDSREERWLALEEDIVSQIQKPHMIFRPKLVRLTNATPNTSPDIPVKELVHIEIKVENPLLVGLVVSNMKPICEYFSNGMLVNDGLFVHDIPSFFLPPQSSDFIRVRMVPQILGKFTVKGASFSVALSDSTSSQSVTVEGHNIFKIKGRRLFGKPDMLRVAYSKDERLTINVVSSSAKLSVCLKEPPPIMCCGELFPMDIQFTNDGDIPLINLYVTTHNPKTIWIQSAEDGKEYSKGNQRYTKIPLPNGQLGPLESHQDCIWLHAPLEQGAFDLELLFYYETRDYSIPKHYRVLRHLSSIYLEHPFSLHVSSSQSLDKPYGDMTHSSHLIAHIKVYDESECMPDIISLLGVSVNSPRWVLNPQELQGPILVKGRNSCGFCVSVNHIKIEPKDLLSSKLLFGKSRETLPCWTSFSLKERLVVSNLLSENSASPASDFVPTKSLKEIEYDLIKGATTLDLVFTVMWKSFRGDTEIRGQQNVHLKDIGDVACAPLSSRIDECQSLRIIPENEVVYNPFHFSDIQKSNLVKVSIKSMPMIEHDFNQNVLCQIHYMFTLYNCCGTKLSGTICFNPNRNSSAQMPVKTCLKNFFLNPYESRDLKSASVVTCPGTYAIGHVILKLRTVETGEEWTQDVDDYMATTIVSPLLKQS